LDALEVSDRVRDLEAETMGPVPVLTYVHKEAGLAKQCKVDSLELEEHLVDAIKACTTVDRDGIP